MGNASVKGDGGNNPSQGIGYEEQQFHGQQQHMEEAYQSSGHVNYHEHGEWSSEMMTGQSPPDSPRAARFLAMFTPQVTKCKHGYHLQCILEWSQRSKECPICWQLLVLKDPDSQELLAAVEIERNSRSRQRLSNASTIPRISFEDIEFDQVPPYTDDSDFDERLMQHLAAVAMGRPHNFSRRVRHTSPGLSPSQSLVLGSPSDGSDIEQTVLSPSQSFVFGSPSYGSDIEQTHTTAPIGIQNVGTSAPLPESNSTAAVMSSDTCAEPQSIMLSSCLGMGSNATVIRRGFSIPGVPATPTPPASPRRSRPSELLSFSESLKSRFSAASSRYKESISKNTRGFKEKLLARNNSVKELSKEVQREVTAGISGVARMMERLDPTSKRGGPSGQVIPNRKVEKDNLTPQSHNANERDIVHGTSSNAAVHVNSTPIPGRMEVTRVQDIL